MKQIDIREIRDFKIGNAQSLEGATGCTAIICEKGAAAGVDVRGGSPATRETDLLDPVNTVQQIQCVMLSGGSAFGLEACDGAMQYLGEHDIGFQTGFGTVPIVCGASLFDIFMGDPAIRPDKAMGYEACRAAFDGEEVREGNAGAGTGATVGKLRGVQGIMKSGLGVYAAQLGEVQCAAVVSVNALGDIVDFEDRKILAGLLNDEKTEFVDSVQEIYKRIETPTDIWSGNTTIGCIITNAKLTKTQCNKLASIAHNAYAQTIRPVHTTADGDTIFVMASGEVPADPDALGALAVEVMAHAVNHAATKAESLCGIPAARDLKF